jgi:hypothetical protein
MIEGRDIRPNYVMNVRRDKKSPSIKPGQTNVNVEKVISHKEVMTLKITTIRKQ